MTNAYKGCLTGFTIVGTAPARLRSVVASDKQYALGGEDFTQGNPAQPSLRLDALGSWRYRWALTIGQHSVAVNVLQVANLIPRPSLCIKSNPAIGIPLDVEIFAPMGTGWVTISSATFTVSALGVVWVELRNNLDANVGASPCYFDHIAPV